MYKKTLIGMVGLFILAWLVQACGNVADNPKVAPAATSASAAQVQFTPGAYITRITARDISPQLAADLPEGSGSSYLGKWQFNFGEGGDFSAWVENQPVVFTGQYSQVSEGMSFTGKAWVAYCPGTSGNEDGVYGSYFDGYSLALYPISDSCPLRRLVLSAHSLSYAGTVVNNSNSGGGGGGVPWITS
jgi:hypothetical protein